VIFVHLVSIHQTTAIVKFVHLVSTLLVLAQLPVKLVGVVMKHLQTEPVVNHVPLDTIPVVVDANHALRIRFLHYLDLALAVLVQLVMNPMLYIQAVINVLQVSIQLKLQLVKCVPLARFLQHMDHHSVLLVHADMDRMQQVPLVFLAQRVHIRLKEHNAKHVPYIPTLLQMLLVHVINAALELKPTSIKLIVSCALLVLIQMTIPLVRIAKMENIRQLLDHQYAELAVVVKKQPVIILHVFFVQLDITLVPEVVVNDAHLTLFHRLMDHAPAQLVHQDQKSMQIEQDVNNVHQASFPLMELPASIVELANIQPLLVALPVKHVLVEVNPTATQLIVLHAQQAAFH